MRNIAKGKERMRNKGKVYIVGAGPGDLELITLKAVRILKNCDVVLYDKRANPAALSFCSEETEKIFVGKEAGKHSRDQEEIIDLLIEKAKAGKVVLRLKGGDPYIFGRGSEEALALRKSNIEFEVVPAVTAASAASAYAGIPLTHRKLVSQCVFLTAHEAPGKMESQIEWEFLAKMRHTNIAIYMGVSSISQIVETLIKFGADPTIPAALVENASLSKQRTIVGALEDIPDISVKRGVKPPVIFFISKTAEFSQQLNWYESKPLIGRTIVVTRPRDQAKSLIEKLEIEGAATIKFPLIKTEFAEPPAEFDLTPAKYDWTIFTSYNGVRYFFEALRKRGKDSRALGGTKIGVIGSSTADKLKEYNVFPDFTPSKFTSQNLAKELSEQFDIKRKNVLRVKGDFKRDILTESLRDFGAIVDKVEVYKLSNAVPSESEVYELKSAKPDAFLFTSPSTVRSFHEIFGDKTLDILENSLSVAIGPVTLSALIERGISNTQAADKHNVDGLVEKTIELFHKG